MVLLATVYYSSDVFNGIQLAVYMNLVPMDLVFQEGINLQDYDASVIINCLHGGGCPEGIQYKNDDTGEIEQREVVSKTAQPYTPPEDPNAPPDPRTIPDGKLPEPIQQITSYYDALVFSIVAIIIITLIVVMVIFLKKHHKQ